MERAQAEAMLAGDRAVAVELLLRLDAVVTTLTERNASLERRVEELERGAKRSSRTSHQPPSADGPGAPRRAGKPPSDRQRGGQAGHDGHHRALCSTPDEVVEVLPVVCAGCGAPLAAGSVIGARRHQVWEIPAPQARVSEHRLLVCQCGCGTRTTATLPVGVPAGMFGANLEAAIVGLTLSERVSRRRVCEVIEELCGVTIGLGTIDRVLHRSAHRLTAALTAIDAEIRTAAVVNVDETSWAEAGKKTWAWAATTPRAVRLRLEHSRGRIACHALIGETPPGIVATDRFGAYNHLPLSQRQICWAHLARDFRAVAERPGRIGQIASRLVIDTSRMFTAYTHHRNNRNALGEAITPIRRRIDDHLDLLARCGEDTQAAEFALNLLVLGPALWTFVDNPAVEPTNNAAERVLRPLAIHRKTSYGTNTPHGSRIYETLQSIVQTLRLQHANVYAWLRDALTAANHHRPLPAIIPP